MYLMMHIDSDTRQAAGIEYAERLGRAWFDTGAHLAGHLFDDLRRTLAEAHSTIQAAVADEYPPRLIAAAAIRGAHSHLRGIQGRSIEYMLIQGELARTAVLGLYHYTQTLRRSAHARMEEHGGAFAPFATSLSSVADTLVHAGANTLYDLAYAQNEAISLGRTLAASTLPPQTPVPAPRRAPARPRAAAKPAAKPAKRTARRG
jgi:hypothetical protein